jgi:hypothetical protein
MAMTRTGLFSMALLAGTALSPHAGAQGVGGKDASAAALPASKANDATQDGYRLHLQMLAKLVDQCAKARDMSGCDPAHVGPDDEVPISAAPDAERRLVRYGWLRVLISKARDKDEAPPKTPPAAEHESATWENVRPLPPTTTQLLEAAKTRLAHDQAQIDAPVTPLPDHAQEQAAMKEVLAGREFRDLEEPSAKDSTMEKVGNWLNRIIETAVEASARAPWLGRALVWGFVALACVALVWGLLQLERRWRLRLLPERETPAPGAASAIPWQLWLEDARRAAAAGLWREAIHFLYWASISRLESKRMWPADRARTPREYLALVAPEDPRQPGLATLTRSFERVWYGGRAAGEGDYKTAEQLASGLIQGFAGGAGAEAGGTAE